SEFAGGSADDAKPSVSLLQPSSMQLSGGSATLACLLTGYSPQGAEVIWEVDGTEVIEGVLTSSEEEKSGRYSSSSTLTLSHESWMNGDLYSCKVNHHEHTQSQSLRRSQCAGLEG
uniref:Ig-like domain-containing protein n=1 Tax=Amphilophus citrinellus TaxID=61819 RepID=A0A3Q0R8Z6_AMPCI